MRIKKNQWDWEKLEQTHFKIRVNKIVQIAPYTLSIMSGTLINSRQEEITHKLPSRSKKKEEKNRT